MKKTRQHAALLLAGMLLMTACGGGGTETFADNARSTIAASAPATEASTPAATPSTPAQATPSGAHSAGVLGEKEGNVYTNTFLDLRLDLTGSDWSILNDEEISKQMQIAQQVMDDNGVRSLLDEGGIYYDLYASNVRGDILAISLQSLGAEQTAVLGGQETETALLEVAGQHAAAGYEQMGLQNVSYEIGSVNFLGEEKPAVITHVSSIMNQCVVVIIRDGYLATVMSTALGDGDAIDMLESFTRAN